MLTTAKRRLTIIYKLLPIAAFVAVVLNISYSVVSAAGVPPEVALCCYESEYNETTYTVLCCDGDDADCYLGGIPPVNESYPLSGLFQSTHRNDMCDMQIRLSDDSFAELFGLKGEECLNPIRITYAIFHPPKV